MKSKTNSRSELVITKKLLPNSKRSQAHVEIIIAFVLFVGILLTFFLLIKPFSYTEEKPVENIKQTILNSVTEEIGILSAITTSSSDCYSLDNVKDDYGTNFIEIKDNPRKYTIYFNQMFVQRTISCQGQPENFQLGVFKKQDFITKPKITTFKENYETDYNQLKQTLGIRNDFSIEFRDFQQNTIQELTPTNLKTPPVGINVVAKEFPVQVIDKDANIINYILNLRVW